MPYIDGKRVTLTQWKALQKKSAAAPAATDEETDAILGTPTKKSRSNIVKNVALAATGTVIEDETAEVEVEENEGGITE